MRSLLDMKGTSRSAPAAARRGLGTRLAATILVAAFALAPMAAPAFAQESPSATETSTEVTPLERVQALVQPAVVYEQITWTGYIYDKYNKRWLKDAEAFTVVFQCTGFIVNPDGYIGTAGHCVDYDDGVKDALLQQGIDWAYESGYYADPLTKEEIAAETSYWRVDGQSKKNRPDQEVQVAYGVSVSGEPSGKAMPALVAGVRAFDKGDVALLKIDAEDLTVVPLSDNEDTGVGTQIVSIGYPASVDLVTDNTFDPSFKEGSISAEKTVSGGLLPVYEISAAVSGGMSGGPTTALDGQVIGVNSFGITGETQPFNFVQPSQTLEELMRAEGVENELGEVTDLYRAGLEAYFNGDKNAATENFDKVLNIVPNHQFAADYKRKAQDLPDQAEASSSGGGGSSTLIIILIVAAVVVIGVVVALLLRRNKGAAAGDAAPAAAAPAGTPPATGAPAAPAPAAPAATETPAAPPAVETPAQETPAPAAEETAQFCPHCGAQHDPGARFCPSCGKELSAG